jgi:hypothetical protein
MSSKFSNLNEGFCPVDKIFAKYNSKYKYFLGLSSDKEI